VIYLTTQSDEAPAGVFAEKLKYYRDVRDGKVLDPRSLGVLYEFPADMVASQAYLKPENFYVTNPNLGRSVNVAWLEDQLQKNVQKGLKSGALQQFLAKHLNVEIGVNLRSDRWAGAEFWEQQGIPGLTLEQIIERSEVLEIGIDGGGLDDLLGLAVIGRDASTGEWLAWCRAYANKVVLERRKSEASLLLDLQREGTLVLCEDFGLDVLLVAEVVRQCEQSELLDRIGVDQAGIGGIVDAITDVGVSLDRIVGISQGYRLTSAIKTTERKLSERRLSHEGSRLMAWCVGNARVEQKGNAIVITKQVAGAGKIDPLMATFNAVELMSRNPAGMRSFWDKDE
jgi:phage terminase large subunit-like protein